MNEEKHEFHISLEKDVFNKLESIKEYHGIKNITEIIRFLITKEHREIKNSE
jgi:predicted CopG family antitoxin